MKEMYCNILDTDCNVVCVTTNGFVKQNGECVMGRGIAKQVKDLFPDIPKVLGTLIRTRGNNVHILKQVDDITIVSFPVKPDYVINRRDNVVKHCPTVIGSKTVGFYAKADIRIIKQSLHQLVDLANQHPEWKTILLPRVGCGAGELDWKDIKPICEEILDDRFIACTY